MDRHAIPGIIFMLRKPTSCDETSLALWQDVCRPKDVRDRWIPVNSCFYRPDLSSG